MKTERRHELQENELANWLGEKLNKFQPYSKTILGLLVLGAVSVLASAYIRGRGEQGRQAAWASYFDAMTVSDPAAFEDVAARFPGTNAAEWSLQRAADLRLDLAIRQMFQDRELAQQELQAARDAYEQLLDESRDEMILQRAAYGLAKCLESQGQFDQAVERYNEVVSKWSGSPFAELAEERLTQLKQPATKQWYDWFAEQKPVASPLTDPSLFQDLPNLPDSPDLDIPDPGQLLGPGSSSANESPASSSGLDDGFDLNLGPATSNTEDVIDVEEVDASIDDPATSDFATEASDDVDLGTELDLELPADDSQAP